MRKVLAIVLLLFSIPYYYGNASATDTLQALGVY